MKLSEEIRKAVAEGKAVPVVCRSVQVQPINATMKGEESAAVIAREIGDRKAMVFTNQELTADIMANALNASGIPAKSITWNTSLKDGIVTVEAFHSGEIQVLVGSKALVFMGINTEHVSAVVLMRSTKSETEWQQMVTRGIRPSPGKKDCLILDLTGNSGKIAE